MPAATATAAFVLDMQTAVAKFRADVDQMIGHGARFQRTLEGAFTGSTRSINGFLGSVTGLQLGIGALTGAGIGLLIRRSLESADALDEMASRIGIGVESLQELQYAAKVAGVSTEELETGLRNLNRRLSEAAGGEGEAVKLFKDLGIAVTGSDGRIRDLDAVLDDFANRMKNAGSQAERTRLEMLAFGRSGSRLQTLFEDGAEGIQKMRDEAQAFGITLSQFMVKQAVAAQDSLDRLSVVVEKNLVRAVIALAPHIETAAKQLATLAASASTVLEALQSADKAGSDELAHRVSAISLEIDRLQKEANQISSGETLGDKINKFFGQGENTQKRIAELKQEREELRKTLRERLHLEAAPVKITDKPSGPTAEQLEAFQTLRERLAGLGGSGQQIDEVGKAIAGISIETEKAKEKLPGMTKEIDALKESTIIGFLESEATVGKFLDAIESGDITVNGLTKSVKALAAEQSELKDAFGGELQFKSIEDLLDDIENAPDIKLLAEQAKSLGDAFSHDFNPDPAAALFRELGEGNEVLQVYITKGPIYAKLLEEENRLRAQGITLTAGAREELLKLITAQQALSTFDTRVKGLQDETQQLMAQYDVEIALTTESRSRARVAQEELLLRQQGVSLTEDQRNRLLETIQAQEQLREGTQATILLQQEGLNIAEGIGNELISAAVEGKINWEDFLKNLIKRLLTVQNIVLAIKALSKIGGGDDAGADVALAGGGSVEPNRLYMVGEQGPELFISRKPGEILSNKDSRELLAMLGAGDAEGEDVQNAPPLASGTMRLRKPGQGKAAVAYAMPEQQAPNVEINIHNNNGSDVQQRRSRGGDGKEIVDIMISANRSDAARGGLDQVMAQRYGLLPTRGSR